MGVGEKLRKEGGGMQGLFEVCLDKTLIMR